MVGITIDQLDLSVYNNYAIRTLLNEQINQQMRLSEASSIPPQTFVLDMDPRLREMDLLLGILPLNTPWALFLPPKQAKRRRRSPFSFYRVAPTFGPTGRHDEETDMLERYECEDKEEEEEKESLLACLKQMKNINGWMGFIVGRIGQFLQG